MSRTNGVEPFALAGTGALAAQRRSATMADPAAAYPAYRILLVGDTHADFNHVAYASRIATENNVSVVVQVGDFGYWPRSRYMRAFVKHVDDLAREANQIWYWIDGNHEDHQELRAVATDVPVAMGTNLIYVPRGYVTTWNGCRVMFLGGADSIDKEWRTEGVSWFPEERLTHRDVDRALNAGKVDLLIAHDMPTVAFESQRGPARWLLSDSWGESHRAMLQAVMDSAQPQVYVHGHMHYEYTMRWKDTTIYGLDCNNYMPKSWVILSLDKGKVTRG